MLRSPLPQVTNESVSNTPGLHIVANLTSTRQPLLVASAEFKKLIDSLIKKYELNNLGEVYYDFPTGGFTAVVCLAESHLSVHTWPEKNFITFDVFLSNYLKDNRNITEALYHAVCDFFEAEILEEHFLKR